MIQLHVNPEAKRLSSVQRKKKEKESREKENYGDFLLLSGRGKKRKKFVFRIGSLFYLKIIKNKNIIQLVIYC